jgi:hypothetical protein
VEANEMGAASICKEWKDCQKCGTGTKLQATMCSDCHRLWLKNNVQTLTVSRDQWQSDCVELAGAVVELVEWAQARTRFKCENKYLQKAEAVLERVNGDG